jgi:hypothetical protein
MTRINRGNFIERPRMKQMGRTVKGQYAAAVSPRSAAGSP